MMDAERPTEEKNDKKDDGKSAPATEVGSLLQDLRSGVDCSPVRVLPVLHSMENPKRQLVNWSVLKSKLEDLATNDINWPSIIDKSISYSASLDRALGCMMGMVTGDSVGAPLEFIPASSKPISERKGESYVEFDGKSLVYSQEKNEFRLERGQWTDDASMGLCLAESLLVQKHYHGGDARIRFLLWWLFGYCNAFRHDPQRGSVGLGGNIGQSLRDLMDRYTYQPAENVAPHYEARGEDAGNGSLMRLAPIPIRYHKDLNLALKMAQESSYATHPGPDAAYCCRFHAFFVCKAMQRTQDDTTDIITFTNQVIAEFLSNAENAHPKLKSLLESEPPSCKEACWNWKAEKLAIEETLHCRGDEYNGYPVAAGYFGSYCMDGLAMALWAVTHSTSFSDCILRTVNLRGDADTTGAIAGQLAGAFYGYRALLEDACGQRMLQDIRRWDPLYELELRALLLHRDGQNEKAN